MLQPRLPSRDAISSLTSSFDKLTCRVLVRHASHAAQGRANGPKDSAGRRLGAKKTATQYVIPGNIIYKQRGTLWHPGENVGIGKDHTIYSLIHGYVQYYQNPSVHPKRRYIGVAFEKEGPGSKLPSPANAPTRRRLNMHAIPRVKVVQHEEGRKPAPPTKSMKPVNPFDPKYATREGGHGMANFEIGRTMDRMQARTEPFDRKDRFKAWRIRQVRVKEKMAAKQAKKRKVKGKKSAKKI